ncbi:hypothetical protein O9929_12845 [Vibrio lentus]|nr:hypothetical protein [Vibrio lentus]
MPSDQYSKEGRFSALIGLFLSGTTPRKFVDHQFVCYNSQLRRAGDQEISASFTMITAMA